MTAFTPCKTCAAIGHSSGKKTRKNHAPDFKTELFEILMATINGRNDLEILSMTHREISSLTLRLRAQLLN